MTDLSKTSGTSPPEPKRRRTQDSRDRASFIRYARKLRDEAAKLLRAIRREAAQ
jgi:hypothetical protein